MKPPIEVEGSEVEGLADPRAREVMLFVKETMDRLSAMEPQACGEALLSLVATACSWCDDPTRMLADITNRVGQRLAFMSAPPQGNA